MISSSFLLVTLSPTRLFPLRQSADGLRLHWLVHTSKYSAHSTRLASKSAKKGNSISIATIMKSAGWFQESTFAKFYNNPVENKENFGAEHLKAVCGDN